MNFCRPVIAGCNSTFAPVMVTARRTSYQYGTVATAHARRAQKDYANIQWAVEYLSVVGQPDKQAGGTSTNIRIHEKMKKEEKKREVSEHRPTGDFFSPSFLFHSSLGLHEGVTNLANP